MKTEKSNKKTNRKLMTRILATAAAVLLIVVSAGTAYAADVGGIQRQIQIWVHGDQTDASIEFTHDKYTEYVLTYTDENGDVHESSGGGIAYDFFGRERPLTEEELLENILAPTVEYLDDGSIWVFYLDQKIDITDKFDDDGICYVLLDNGSKKIYMTVKYENGWCTSERKFPSPKEFN